LVFSACRKNERAEESPQTQVAKKDWNETAKAVAKDVSLKLNSVYFRKMLKHEVTMRFDGDANILLSSIIKRLPKYLAYEASKNAGSRSNSDETLLAMYNWDIIAAASEDYPQMQIAVQTDAENWNPELYTPSVVYESSEHNEAEKPEVHGFDPEQNPISVSSAIEPELNYVVISQNERTTIRDEQVRLTVSNCLVSEIIDRAPYNPEANAALMTPEDCGGGTGGGGSGGGSGHPQYVGTGWNGRLPTLIRKQTGTDVPPPSNGVLNKVTATNTSTSSSTHRMADLSPVGTFNGQTVYRSDNRHEKMREMRCDDLGQIESWFHGAPEIRLHLFAQNVLNPSETLDIYKEQFEPRKRRDINGKWWDCKDVTMHLWEWTVSGTKASFGYYEFDPSIPVETAVAIGEVIVDVLAITNIIPTGNPTQVAIYGNIRRSIATGIRSLVVPNLNSDYIGKDDYSISVSEDEWEHAQGQTTFKTWPDL
jgi:hypothetical protein